MSKKITQVDVMRQLYEIATRPSAIEDADDAKVRALAHLSHMIEKHGPVTFEEPKPEPSAGLFRFSGPGSAPGTYVIERMAIDEGRFRCRPTTEGEPVPEGTVFNARIFEDGK